MTLIELMDDMHLNSYTDFLEYYAEMSDRSIDKAQDILNKNIQLLNQMMNSENLNVLISLINDNEKKPHEDINEYLKKLYFAFQGLISQTTVKDIFNPSEQYYAHNFVYYKDKAYYAAKTPPLGTLPTNKDYWQEYDIKGVQGYGGIRNLNFVGNWVTGFEYNIGDTIIFKNKLWMAIDKNINYPPNTAHYPWALICLPMLPNKTVIQKKEPIGFKYSPGDLWFEIIDGGDVFQEKWKLIGTEPIPRFATGFFAINNVIYIVGGHLPTQEMVNYVEAYDTVTNTWSQKASYPLILAGMSGFSLGDKGYIVGGLGQTFDQSYAVYEYDSLKNTWTKKKDSPTHSFSYSINPVHNGKAYIQNSLTDLELGLKGKIYEYDIATDTFTDLGEIPNNSAGGVKFVYNNKLYIIGGAHGDTSVADKVYAYDLITKTWEEKAKMPTLRNFCGKFVFGDEVYVLGGANDGMYTMDTVEIYNAATNTWKEETPMLRNVGSLVTYNDDKKGYAIGGICIQYAKIDGDVQVYTK